MILRWLEQRLPERATKIRHRATGIAVRARRHCDAHER